MSLVRTGTERVHVWFFDLIDPADETVLSRHELERAQRFRFAPDRRRFATRRARLRQVLGHHLRCAPQALQFTTGAYGKPALVDHPAVSFSASSSGDDAVVAVGSGELGVDLELAKPTPDIREVATRFFARDEVSQLSDAADFYRCWTRKEAYVKAIGRGLSFPLDSFAVEVADVARPRLLRSSLRPQDVSRVDVVDLSVPAAGYAAALVAFRAGAAAPVQPERRSIHEL